MSKYKRKNTKARESGLWCVKFTAKRESQQGISLLINLG